MKAISEKWMRGIARAVRISIVVLPAIVFVIIMRLIRRVLPIRIAPVASSRIGHLIQNTLLYIADRRTTPRESRFGYDIIFHESGRISNRYVVEKLEEYVKIWPAFFFSTVYNLNRIVPGGRAHDISTLNHLPDIDGVLPGLRLLSFSQDEVSRGLEGLRRLGIDEGAKFIVLHVRDAAYMKDPIRAVRNSDIADYLLAAEALTQLGYYVVRVGATASERIPAINPMIIDYTFSGLRTEFMDVYLGATCFMCIATGSGYDLIPYVFDRRIVFTNYAHLGYASSHRGADLMIFKKYRQSETGNIMTQSEIWKSGAAFGHQKFFDDHNIEVIPNTSKEIRDVVLEMVDRLEGKQENRIYPADLQLRFWSRFYSYHDEKSVWKDPNKTSLEIGSQFLIDHPEFLE